MTIKTVYDHFEGGRKGIKQRYADLIIKDLKGMTGYEAAQLEHHLAIPGFFAALVDNDLDVVTWDVLEPLACSLMLSTEEALGPFINWDENAVTYWENQMKEEQVRLRYHHVYE